MKFSVCKRKVYPVREKSKMVEVIDRNLSQCNFFTSQIGGSLPCAIYSKKVLGLDSDGVVDDRVSGDYKTIEKSGESLR